MTDEVAKKPGRPAKHGRAMTAAERTAKRRERLDMLIRHGQPDRWDHQVCLTILNNAKYEQYREIAWRRLGNLWGYSQQ